MNRNLLRVIDLKMNGVADLEIYRIARELSKESRNIYKKFSLDIQRMVGNQFIRAIDSVGANIAEGSGRFHYLDSIKFYYNARGSLYESKHWLETLYERNLISNESYTTLSQSFTTLGIKLNNFITRTKQLLYQK